MKKILRKMYGILRLALLKIKARHGDTIVKNRIPESNLYLYSKRSHVRSNEHEIVRIAAYVSRCEGDLFMVDVGANIGMVTLMTYKHLQKGFYLCIDGNDDFYPLLQKNLIQIPQSACEKVYLSDHPEMKTMDTKTYVNTACILESPSGKSTDFQTLDDVCIARNLQPNFIKIDTDGYDAKILRGFSKHLSLHENMVVYFEYAPMHQVFNGIEKEPKAIFDYLNSFGFEDYYFYDDQGSFFCSVNYGDNQRIEEITQYCLSSCKLYNVLIIHRNNKKFKEIYSLGEKEYLEKSIKNWKAWWAKH